MRKDQDIQKRSFLRYAAIATALALVFLLLKKDSVIRWIQGGFTIHRQEREIEQDQKRIEELDHQIQTLSTNRDSLEKFAREQYYCSVPDEDVYLEPQ